MKQSDITRRGPGDRILQSEKDFQPEKKPGESEGSDRRSIRETPGRGERRQKTGALDQKIEKDLHVASSGHTAQQQNNTQVHHHGPSMK